MSPFNEFLLSKSLWSLMNLLLLLPVLLNKKITSMGMQMMWLFIFIMTMNLLGLTPYSWTITLYPLITVMLALVLWSTFALSSTLTPYSKWNMRAVSHYLPLTTPIFLWWILPIIEIISQLIRPVTLTVRLTANLIAGHVLIFLVSFLTASNILIYMILIPFEMMVAIVQGYVFIMLLDSYSQER